jgi:transcriptional regulator with XRE-family HTH domain
MDKHSSLAARLKRLREQAGLSAYALAKRAHMRPAVYCRIEAGDRPDPRWSSVQAIAAALGVSTDALRD